jgi:alpha-methylacyl-CoA racemase
MSNASTGPLDGVRIVELAGIGPGPFACMMLADAGADILRIDRPSGGPVGSIGGPKEAAAGRHAEPSWDLLNRNRRSAAVDLKSPDGVALVLDLVEGADILIEGYRAGVAERLGIGPEDCLARNPKLVYGRMTGWGQDGPWAVRSGHDIDYIALSGALWAIGRPEERPVPPLNLVGDFGGGGMLVAFGVLAALVSARVTGRGQVVDAAMVDGAAALMTMTYAFHNAGWWSATRGENLLDSGAPHYEVYETSDGKWFAVGALEPQFYAEMLECLGLDASELPSPMDRSRWPETKKRFGEVFRTKTRDEWAEVFDGTDACGAPVLSPWEAPSHPHNRARGTFVEVAGALQPSPAPRFSGTPTSIRRPPPEPGADTDEVLADWGVAASRIRQLRAGGVIA